MIDTDVERGTFWPATLRFRLHQELSHEEWLEVSVIGRWQKAKGDFDKPDGEFTRHIKEKLGISANETYL